MYICVYSDFWQRGARCGIEEYDPPPSNRGVRWIDGSVDRWSITSPATSCPSGTPRAPPRHSSPAAATIEPRSLPLEPAARRIGPGRPMRRRAIESRGPAGRGGAAFFDPGGPHFPSVDRGGTPPTDGHKNFSFFTFKGFPQYRTDPAIGLIPS